MQWLLDNIESVIPVAGVIYYFFSLYLNAKKEEEETRREIVERSSRKKRNYHQPTTTPDYSDPAEPSYAPERDVFQPYNEVETVATEMAQPTHSQEIPQDYWNSPEPALRSYQEELIRAHALLAESQKRKQQTVVAQRNESYTPSTFTPSNASYKNALRQRSQLKQAFILKEILDSPRSLHS
jgi:hypothetical protein